VVAWSGSVAAVALAAAALIAAVQAKPFTNPLLWVFIGIGAAAALLLFAAGLPDVAAWLGGGKQALVRRGPARSRARLGRWAYTSDAARALTAASNALDVTLPATGYMCQDQDRPGWARFVLLLPSHASGPSPPAPWTRSQFILLLAEPAVAAWAADLTSVPAEAVWVKHAAHGDGVFDAVLTGSDGNAVGVTARLELPGETGRFGRDARCATLIIHIEPHQGDTAPAPPIGAEAWATRIAGFLQLAPVFAGFLTGQLGLRASRDPAPQAAVRLQAPEDIGQMISPGDLEPLPGGRHLRQAAGYFTATRDGASAPDAATHMITHVLRYALSADA
jgi:hypothetical protein